MTVSGKGHVGAIVGSKYRGTISSNEYASNADDGTGAIKWLTLTTGITATNANAADKVTVGGIDYYKPNAIVKFTLDITSNDVFEKITGIKGLTANDDGTFDYTIGATLEFDGYAKIGSLAFDSATNTYTIADKNDLQALRILSRRATPARAINLSSAIISAALRLPYRHERQYVRGHLRRRRQDDNRCLHRHRRQ